MNDARSVDLFHRATCHGEASAGDRARLLPFRSLDPANRPAPFKQYPELFAEPLPRELLRSTLPAAEVLSGATAEPRALDREVLGTILFLGAGVSRVRPGREPKAWYRTAMSAGNLHPVEVYVLHGGLFHYQPLEHALVPLRPASEAAARDGAVLLLTGIPFRTCWKYRERGWRHLFWDAGTVVANVLEAAAAHGIPARIEVGFDDDAVSRLVGLDPRDEVPLAIVRLGDADDPLPPGGALPALRVVSSPVAPRPVRFPLLEEAHAAGALGAGDVAAWQRAGSAACLRAPTEVPPPQLPRDGSTIEDVVRRRGSTRAFRGDTAPADLLDWAAAAATRAVPADFAPSGTLLEHFFSVHAVDGHSPGRARLHAGGGLEDMARLPGVPEARVASSVLCLDQPLGGDSAYTAFHCCDLLRLFRHLGARGYRAAQMEAGIVSERLGLCATAVGAGATGLTFFDGQVSAYFGTATAPMLATAVGLPATAPVPGGEPGRPVVLGAR